MDDIHDGYYNLVKRIADAFSEIDSDICTNPFHIDGDYAELRQEADELQQAHPVIMELFEGEGEISLTKDEHAALTRYFNLKFQIEETERKQIYFHGHTDGFAYLKKIGAI